MLPPRAPKSWRMRLVSMPIVAMPKGVSYWKRCFSPRRKTMRLVTPPRRSTTTSSGRISMQVSVPGRPVTSLSR